QWYDGYLLTVSRLDEENGELCEDGIRRTFQSFRIYNPKSIVKAMTVNNLDNYWDHTGNFAALRDYIDTDQIGLRPMIVEMMQGGRRKIDVRTYQNDLVRFENADDVLTMLIHLGYLTYDARSRETYIPNRELMSEFSTATRESSLRYGKLFGIMKDSAALLKATWNQDTETVAQTIEEMHELVCSAKDYNSELALMFTVEFAYSAARALYTVFPEAPAGKGYADMILVPVDRTHPAMVIELKWNQSVKTAIDQIKEKNYPSRLRLYEGNILCVGISYEKTDAKNAGYKKHACRIERL
ncbi:MAG: PD-(D/E)XK nuclease domain-containing protein, partial [Solobacterium sp.]|nr:PD-(D/E)XK nuclease domain-containing protein [Solobacterium sp.]